MLNVKDAEKKEGGVFTDYMQDLMDNITAVPQPIEKNRSLAYRLRADEKIAAWPF